MLPNGDPNNDGLDKEILEIYQEKLDAPKVGSVVKGKIVQLNESEALLDVGFKSEGVVPLEELKDSEGNVLFSVGDEVEVLIERANYSTGQSTLSRQKALEQSTLLDIEKALEEQTDIEVKVLKKIKGGFEVDVTGIRGFLPASQAQLPRRPREDLTGQTVTVKILQFNRRKKSLVVSRRQVLEKEQEEKKREILSTIKIGQVVPGVVKNITEYGAFIDIGGVDGLLHVTDLSWGRVNHPRDMLTPGQEMDVMVLNIDMEQEKISLGVKQTQEDPWAIVPEKYPLGKKVEGKVVSLVDYGAFVELEPGVEGLLHVSEMSWTQKIYKPSQVLNVGDTVEVAVTDVNLAERKISLSLRQTEPNPWMQLAHKYHVGDKIQGKVRNITDFGAFIEIEEGIDGLVHISDISKNRTLKHPSEVLETDQEVEALITSIDPERQRVSLSIKDAIPDEWDMFAENHDIADVLEGEVTRITEFGVFVEVAKGAEGLVHITEIKRAPNQRLERMFNPGDRVQVKIIRIDKEQRRLGLSMKDIEGDEE